MATTTHRCAAVRSYLPGEFGVQEDLNEIFDSMAASWPGCSFKEFSITVAAEDDAMTLHIGFDVVAP